MQRTFCALSPIPVERTDAQVDSFLREYNTRSIANLTIHEAMPGHYLQLAQSNRCPSVLRALLGSGPFVEGWAVYIDLVMREPGFRGGDPLMQLVRALVFDEPIRRRSVLLSLRRRGGSDAEPGAGSA